MLILCSVSLARLGYSVYSRGPGRPTSDISRRSPERVEFSTGGPGELPLEMMVGNVWSSRAAILPWCQSYCWWKESTENRWCRISSINSRINSFRTGSPIHTHTQQKHVGISWIGVFLTWRWLEQKSENRWFHGRSFSYSRSQWNIIRNSPNKRSQELEATCFPCKSSVPAVPAIFFQAAPCSRWKHVQTLPDETCEVWATSIAVSGSLNRW